MISSNIFLGGILFLVGSSLCGTLAVTLSSLNKVQKQELAEFRTKCTKLDVAHEFMKDEAYLLRYLAAKDFEVQAAFKNFQRVLEARKTANIHSVMKEDWSAYEKRFPTSISSVSKSGNPILYLPFGKWDVNKELETGDAKKLKKYIAIKILEEADRKAQAIRKAGNKDVSQFDTIVDFDGYTIEKQGSLKCIEMYQEISKATEAMYIEANDKTYFINTPNEFKAIYPFVTSSFADKKSSEKVSVLGGQKEFEPVLLKSIDLKEFPKGIRKH